MDIFMQIMWFGTGVAIIVAGVLSGRSRLARYVGRIALFVLFAIAGALMHFIALLSGLETTDFYVTFADTAHFEWVTNAWQAVFVPNQALFVGLLAVFELIVGVLIISGGRQDPGRPHSRHRVPLRPVALRRHPARLDARHAAVPGVAATRRAARSSHSHCPPSGPVDNHCCNVSPALAFRGTWRQHKCSPPSHLIPPLHWVRQGITIFSDAGTLSVTL